jgi:hypothetical protein
MRIPQGVHNLYYSSKLLIVKVYLLVIWHPTQYRKIQVDQRTRIGAKLQ